MKAIALTELRKMELVERPAPQIRRPSDVLLKLEATGVCGSDVHYYATGRIGSQVVKFPFVVGHECAARVIETGKDVTRVKEGDLVAIDPAMPCHTCDQCKLSRENTCRNMKFLGCPGQAEGCLAEYIVMPADTLFPVTGKITAELLRESLQPTYKSPFRRKLTKPFRTSLQNIRIWLHTTRKRDL